jgi:hypothetical protein
MCPVTKVVSIRSSKFLKQRYIIKLHLTVRNRTHHTYHKKMERGLNKIHPTATCNGVSALSSMSTNNVVISPTPRGAQANLNALMKPHTLYYDVALQDSKPFYCVYFLRAFHIKLIRFISISKHLVACSLTSFSRQSCGTCMSVWYTTYHV